MDTVILATGAVALLGATGALPVIMRRRKRRAQLSSSKELAVCEPGRHAAAAPPIEDELARVPVAVTAASARHASAKQPLRVGPGIDHGASRVHQDSGITRSDRDDARTPVTAGSRSAA